MGVPARAAVEAPEGGRDPIWRAAARQMGGADCLHLSALPGTWLACAFRRFASLFMQGANRFLVRGSRQSSGA